MVKLSDEKKFKEATCGHAMCLYFSFRFIIIIIIIIIIFLKIFI